MANKPYILDASILSNHTYDAAERLDIASNRIVFEFPNGFETIPLIEECRALDNIDDFDLMYDITMQMLTGKSVVIYIKDLSGVKHKQCAFQVTDRYMDLRGVEFINNYPVVVTWLTKFIGEMLLKKYPRL